MRAVNKEENWGGPHVQTLSVYRRGACPEGFLGVWPGCTEYWAPTAPYQDNFRFYKDLTPPWGLRSWQQNLPGQNLSVQISDPNLQTLATMLADRLCFVANFVLTTKAIVLDIGWVMRLLIM